VEALLNEAARQHTANVRFTGGEIPGAEEDVKPWLAGCAISAVSSCSRWPGRLIGLEVAHEV
jgi:hypothetical protein